MRLILSRQTRVPFWKPTPASAASPAVGITSRYTTPEKFPIDGITNAGLSPKMAWQTKVAVTDAIRTWARKPLLFRSSMISSRTKVMADNGVLNAAANPAAAPDRRADGGPVWRRQAILQ